MENQTAGSLGNLVHSYGLQKSSPERDTPGYSEHEYFYVLTDAYAINRIFVSYIYDKKYYFYSAILLLEFSQ